MDQLIWLPVMYILAGFVVTWTQKDELWALANDSQDVPQHNVEPYYYGIFAVSVLIWIVIVCLMLKDEP